VPLFCIPSQKFEEGGKTRINMLLPSLYRRKTNKYYIIARKNKHPLSILNVYITIIFLSSLIINIFNFHFVEGDDNYKKLTNETFIGNTNQDAKTLVKAFSNDAYLSSYTIPKIGDLVVKEGNWTIEKLSKAYPDVIERMNPQNSKDTFFVKKSILIDQDVELDILNSKLLLKSLSNKDNNPVVIITNGKTNIINSSVMSWDPDNKRPDPNPYHPRSFLVAKNGGQMNIIGSNISYLGFSLAGTHTLLSSLAGLAYYNTSQFTIANSTLDNNLYGFYSDESSKFKINNNEIYANIKYGLDPHSGSADFIIDSNHIFANGGQGIICSFMCKNITVTNNVVEYNIEGIGLHWLTNSSIVKNNIIKYNKGYGIYIKTNSYNNMIINNTILGNGNGIGLLDNSNENTIKSNILRGNILEKNQIHEDVNSQSNIVEDNIYTK